MHQPLLAPTELLGVEQDQFAKGVRRPGVDAHPHTVDDGALEVSQRPQLAADHLQGSEEARRGDHIPARNPAVIDVGEVDGRRVPGTCHLNRVVVGLQAAHLAALPQGQDLQHLADLDRSADRDAGQHGSEAAHAEDPLHRHPKDPFGRARRRLFHLVRQHGTQLLHPLAGHGGEAHQGSPLQESALQGLAQDLLGQVRELRVDQIDLGQYHHSALHPDQLHDRQVFAGLGHDPVVGSHDEQDEIDSGRSRHHVAHETLVPGDVDDAHRASTGEVEARETQVDGHSARFLLLPAVRVGAGQGPHEGGLAVVDVAGGTDDDGLDLHGSPGG